MPYLRLFPQNNHFFKPKRLVWVQEAEPKPSEVPDKITKKEEKFIQELHRKFINYFPGISEWPPGTIQAKLKILKESTDWSTIMKHFKAAKSYEVKPPRIRRYRSGKRPDEKLPAIIIFTYSDGKKIEHPLELTHKRHEKDAKEFLMALKEMSEGRKREIAGARETIRKVDRGSLEEWHRRQEETLERARYLKTPNDAHRELRRITTHLPDDLLEDLSTPLSGVSKIWSNYSEIDPDTGYPKFSESDRSMRIAFADKLASIFKNKYGEEFMRNISPGQKEDLEAIVKTFGIGG